jgi:hypothetical protein
MNRQMIQGAVQQAAGMMQKTIDNLSDGARLTDLEAAEFYRKHLRGRPDRILEFVRKHSNTDSPLDEANRYVQSMEAILEGE